MNKYLTFILLVLVTIISIAASLISFRILSFFLSLAFLGSIVSYVWHKNTKVVIVFWVLFLISIIIPFDIRWGSDDVFNLKIMKYVSGYLSDEGMEFVKQGKIYNPGCISFPNEPGWVLVF